MMDTIVFDKVMAEVFYEEAKEGNDICDKANGGGKLPPNARHV